MKSRSLKCVVLPLLGVAAPFLLLALTAVRGQQKSSKMPTPSQFDATVRPFLTTHCLSCHKGANASAGMSVEPFLNFASIAKDPDTWRQFAHKIRTGQMPPAGSPRPDALQAKAVTNYIFSEIERNEKAVRAEAGRVTARRLNRAEYNNTIRDLLGFDIHPADDFPQDDSGYGFDNIGDALSVSPPLMEKYLTTAERVARTAIFGQVLIKPRLVELRTPRKNTQPPAAIPAKYDESGLTMPSSVHASYRFPADGKYEIRSLIVGYRADSSDPMRFALWIDGKKTKEIELNPYSSGFPGEALELAGQTANFGRIQMKAGDHWLAATMIKMYEGLPASMGGPNPSKKLERKATSRFPMQEPPKDATPAELEKFKKQQEMFKQFIEKFKKGIAHGTRLWMLEVGGPYEQERAVSQKTRALLYTCGHLDGKHLPICSRKIISDFAQRAFRRPVNAKEVAPYLRLFAEARQQGDSFDEGLCVALQGILVSPHFLFRVEHDAPARKGVDSNPVNEYELASRLSYFLWASMPDAELLRCADAKTLRKPNVLKAQLERMLRDKRADALVENFAGQWLELRKIEAIKPDGEKFPDYDEYLRLSMRKETELFFGEMVHKDRSILDLIDGNYTYLNDRMAQFYGIPGVEGPEWRRVDLTGTNRGGVLTQASVLTVSSLATRTSPVLRGKWILDNFLNTPPPPPPPGIPSLEETKITQGASLRQQLEGHRKKPLCASCHARLDPLGFGLENFDATGAWRTVDGKTPIDSSGVLPGGRSFSGPAQLKAILKKDKDAFTRCLATKLLTYALGRGLERYDNPTVKQIAADVAKSDYRFSRLVLDIATSLPFQQRKGEIPREPNSQKLAGR